MIRENVSGWLWLLFLVGIGFLISSIPKTYPVKFRYAYHTTLKDPEDFKIIKYNSLDDLALAILNREVPFVGMMVVFTNEFGDIRYVPVDNTIKSFYLDDEHGTNTATIISDVMDVPDMETCFSNRYYCQTFPASTNVIQVLECLVSHIDELVIKLDYLKRNSVK